MKKILLIIPLILKIQNNLHIRILQETKCLKYSNFLCIACKEPYYLKNSDCVLCNKEGEYIIENQFDNLGRFKCGNCYHKCKSCSYLDINKCKSCKNSYPYYHAKGGNCEKYCLNNYFENKKFNCVDKCEENYFTDYKNKKCKPCKTGCKKCPNSPDKCSECLTGYYLNFEKLICTRKCDFTNGYYIDSKNFCKRCFPLCQTCNHKANKCTSCKNNYLLSNNYCIEKCPDGMFEIKENNIKKCKLCEQNCKKCIHNNYCLQCKKTNYELHDMNSNNKFCLKKCFIDYYFNIFKKVCEKCNNCNICYNKGIINCIGCKDKCNIKCSFKINYTQNGLNIAFLDKKLISPNNPNNFLIIKNQDKNLNIKSFTKNNNSYSIKLDKKYDVIGIELKLSNQVISQDCMYDQNNKVKIIYYPKQKCEISIDKFSEAPNEFIFKINTSFSIDQEKLKQKNMIKIFINEFEKKIDQIQIQLKDDRNFRIKLNYYFYKKDFKITFFFNKNIVNQVFKECIFNSDIKKNYQVNLQELPEYRSDYYEIITDIKNNNNQFLNIYSYIIFSYGIILIIFGYFLDSYYYSIGYFQIINLITYNNIYPNGSTRKKYDYLILNMLIDNITKIKISKINYLIHNKYHLSPKLILLKILNFNYVCIIDLIIFLLGIILFSYYLYKFIISSKKEENKRIDNKKKIIYLNNQLNIKHKDRKMNHNSKFLKNDIRIRKQKYGNTIAEFIDVEKVHFSKEYEIINFFKNLFFTLFSINIFSFFTKMILQFINFDVVIKNTYLLSDLLIRVVYFNVFSFSLLRKNYYFSNSIFYKFNSNKLKSKYFVLPIYNFVRNLVIIAIFMTFNQDNLILLLLMIIVQILILIHLLKRNIEDDVFYFFYYKILEFTVLVFYFINFCVQYVGGFEKILLFTYLIITVINILGHSFFLVKSCKDKLN